jgi:hypothetical protein
MAELLSRKVRRGGALLKKPPRGGEAHQKGQMGETI